MIEPDLLERRSGSLRFVVDAAEFERQQHILERRQGRQQMERLKHDKKRPLLQTENPRERLESLLAERKPLYLELADLRIPTDKKFARKVAAEIVPQLPSYLN